MSDSVSKARHFHQRADECTKLAELATSDRVREHYKKLAAAYLALAQAELTHAEKRSGRRNDS
jgi:hypothetical protein